MRTWSSRRSNSAASPAISTKRNKPLILGHRGASAVAPENTIAAFTQALSAGADGIELDVRLARDGVPVVIHDATLRRTASLPGSIRELTSKHLAQVDVGTWFNRASPKLARSQYADERVPTLTQAFEVCQKPATVYVEMKSETESASNNLAHAVAALIKAFKFHDRVVVVSFDLDAIRTLKKVDSSIRTGGLFGSTRIAGRDWRENLLARATDCGANELLLHRLLARKKLVEKAQENDLPVVVWTVDDAKWIERARILGLHALITNHPAKLLAAS